MVNEIEKWLQKCALDGWKLVRHKGWLFYFVKANKKKRRYFMYIIFDAKPGFYPDYFNAKKKYKKAKSHLNDTSLDIFEVDTSKIDSEYQSYIKTRNKYYRRQYTKLLLFFTLFLITLGITLYSHLLAFFILSAIPHLMFVYSIISIIVLSFSCNQ